MAVAGGEEMNFIKANFDSILELLAVVVMCFMIYTNFTLYAAYEEQVQENQTLAEENQALLDLLIEARKNHEAE